MSLGPHDPVHRRGDGIEALADTHLEIKEGVQRAADLLVHRSALVGRRLERLLQLQLQGLDPRVGLLQRHRARMLHAVDEMLLPHVLGA